MKSDLFFRLYKIESKLNYIEDILAICSTRELLRYVYRLHTELRLIKEILKAEKCKKDINKRIDRLQKNANNLIITIDQATKD